jgi:chitinase
MGFPLYAVGWTGAGNVNHGLYQSTTGVSPILRADGTGLCLNVEITAPPPGCDTLLTPGFLTYTTVEKILDKNGYTFWYDAQRVSATLYNSDTQTFFTFDNPTSIAAKAAYIKKHKLGGAYVWALNHDDANGTLTKVIAEEFK